MSSFTTVKTAGRRRATTLVPQRCHDLVGSSFGVLKSNMDAATSDLAAIFATSFRKKFGDFALDEVEVALEVSADGRVGIMGSGMGIRGGGSVKLKFFRRLP
jgi:hypothetical protein